MIKFCSLNKKQKTLKFYKAKSVKIKKSKFNVTIFQGTCYFLAAVGALCNEPSIIDLIFINRTSNFNGVYGVSVFLDGQKTELLLDDLFPCYGTEPLGAQSYQNIIWVMLLEKSWLKYCQSYHFAEKGQPTEAFEYLTGYPSIEITEKDRIFSTPQMMISYLKYCQDKKYYITVGTKNEKDLNKKYNLLPDHAFSFITFHQNDNLTLIKLLNPLGYFQFEGDYNQESLLWTTKVKALVDFKYEKNGIFYVTIEEFFECFNSLCVGFHKYLYKIQNLKLQQYGFTNKSNYFELELEQSMEVSITINQPLKRKKIANGWCDYDYSPVDIQLYSVKNGIFVLDRKFTQTHCGHSKKYFGDFSVSVNEDGTEPFIPLEKGLYMIKAKVRFGKKPIQPCSITVCSQYDCKLQIMPRNKAKQNMRDCYINLGYRSLKQIDDNISMSTTEDKDGHQIIFVKNNGTRRINFEMSFQLKNMNLGKAYKVRYDQVLICLNPQQQDFIVVKPDDKSQKYLMNYTFSWQIDKLKISEITNLEDLTQKKLDNENQKQLNII